jgi:hypothetical protein
VRPPRLAAALAAVAAPLGAGPAEAAEWLAPCARVLLRPPEVLEAAVASIARDLAPGSGAAGARALVAAEPALLLASGAAWPGGHDTGGVWSSIP